VPIFQLVDSGARSADHQGARGMAYDEQLAARVREVLKESKGITEKKMFGGLCFLLDGKMICGVRNDDLIAKIGKDSHEKMANLKHVRPFDFTGKPMKSIVYVALAGLKTKKELTEWIEMGKKHVRNLHLQHDK
jgi:TfoX/Sxy family transcriptional regulator of competence genes